MGNKRNHRRTSQRVRAEISRKPKRVTKAQEAFVAALPKERARKESERYWKKPTKHERQAREKRIRRWKLGRRGNNPPRKPRKRRTSVKKYLPTHSLDN